MKNPDNMTQDEIIAELEWWDDYLHLLTDYLQFELKMPITDPEFQDINLLRCAAHVNTKSHDFIRERHKNDPYYPKFTDEECDYHRREYYKLVLKNGTYYKEKYPEAINYTGYQTEKTILE